MNKKWTLRLWKGRLCIWPGNVQNQIHKDDHGELVVPNVHALARFEYGQAQRLLRSLGDHIASLLRDGFSVVVYHLPGVNA